MLILLMIAQSGVKVGYRRGRDFPAVVCEHGGRVQSAQRGDHASPHERGANVHTWRGVRRMGWHGRAEVHSLTRLHNKRAKRL